MKAHNRRLLRLSVGIPIIDREPTHYAELAFLVQT
jgi:hypothetical protein